jgi:hypothetical protein
VKPRVPPVCFRVAAVQRGGDGDGTADGAGKSGWGGATRGGEGGGRREGVKARREVNARRCR